MTQTQQVKDLRDGQTVNSVFKIIRAEQRESRNGKPYVALELADATGRIAAKQWDCDALPQMRFARICGVVETYNGNCSVVLSAPPLAADVENEADFTACAPLPIAVLRCRLDAHIAAVADPSLSRLLHFVFDDDGFRRKFDDAPAAQKMHHAVKHGLLQHTVETADIAAAMADAQASWGYARIVCRDLTVTGALLHDAGKVYETARDENEWETTERGELLGHTLIGIEWLNRKIGKIAGFPMRLRDQLLHVIASHHGRGEWGASIAPKLLEAQLVHFADYVGAQLFYFAEASESASEAFVKTRGLDGRRIWTGEIALTPSPKVNSLPIFRFVTANTTVKFQTRAIPLLGRAAAGTPIRAEQHIEDYRELDDSNLPDGELYLLRVAGESMTGDEIFDGDIVLVRRQERVEPTEIAVVFLQDDDEGATLKRLEHQPDGSLRLLPSNPSHAPIEIPDPRAALVQGRVLGKLEPAEEPHA